MTGKEFKKIHDTIEQENFDYCFNDYADFQEIKDEEFHRLRVAYLDARKALAEYIGFED